MLSTRRVVGLSAEVRRGIKPQYIQNKRVSDLHMTEAKVQNPEPNTNLSQPKKEEAVSQAVKFVFLKPPPRIFSSSIKAVYTSATGNPIKPVASDVGDKAAEVDKDLQSRKIDQLSTTAQQTSEVRSQGDSDATIKSQVDVMPK